MYRITKDFAFSASHWLDGLPDDHQCARLHGHNYVVRITLAAHDPNEVGFVLDYGELRPFQQYLDETFDHRHLNDFFSDVNPTAENLANHLFTWARIQFGIVVEAVAVSETPKTWAEFTLRP